MALWSGEKGPISRGRGLNYSMSRLVIFFFLGGREGGVRSVLVRSVQ